MAIGQFVGAGEISRSDAEYRLYGAAMANGYVAKDGEASARATIKSGLDAGERQPRDIPESDGLPDGDPVFVANWVARLKAANDNARFQITWFDEVNQSVVKEEVLKGVLGVGEFSLFVAKPGTAKSVLVGDIGCHIAAGLDWHGRKVKQGLVVFFAAERKKLTERRIAAWRKKHGITNIPFVVVGGKLDLTTGLVDAKALATTIAKLEQKSGHSCVLIILDTVTRTFGPGDQHQSKDMSEYIQSVDALIGSRSGCVVAHHFTRTRHLVKASRRYSTDAGASSFAADATEPPR
jgi:RecA-family ATPase